MEIVPLGGLGQFGMNATLLRSGAQAAVVDAGMMFPSGEFWGIDAILPDVTAYLADATRLVAIVLTHGHDDHIGGVPRLMQETDCPVYGARMTGGGVKAG